MEILTTKDTKNKVNGITNCAFGEKYFNILIFNEKGV
jgi:hypothetical protein